MARKPSTVAIPAPRPGHPLRPERQPRPRLTLELLTRLAGRLTPRDRWLLRMLHEHRVLTTVQITQLAFGAHTTAAHRITTAELGYRRDRALAIFHSATLAHTVGVNGFFTALTAYARASRGC